MFKISKFTCENFTSNPIIDTSCPIFNFKLDSDVNCNGIKCVKLKIGNHIDANFENNSIRYTGNDLKPLSKYIAELEIEDINSNVDKKSIEFLTGRMNKKFNGSFITDITYKFKEKHISPTPMLFKKTFVIEKNVKSAFISSTALGIYNIYLNDVKISNDYFAPGFTSYKHTLQYQLYDVKDFLKIGENIIEVVLTGGWAIGSYLMNRKNRITAKRQALLLDLDLLFEDSSLQTIKTDDSWLVSRNSKYKQADLYDGQVYDNSIDNKDIKFINAGIEKVKIKPNIVLTQTPLVCQHEVFKPISVSKVNNELIYDFSQNMAGVLHFKVNGKKGQKIIIKHAEVLNSDGSLCTKFLRSAKARIEYTCDDGINEFQPTLTYMGFRYISVSNVSEEDIEIEAIALYSDVNNDSYFECSNPLLNKLQENIKWSGKSNFVEIPTDCPQRDERLGWTGDIALFSNTACLNFEMHTFLKKWLNDLKSEQLKSGGIPSTIPSQGYGFPQTMPKKALAFWSDACILVPYALYLTYNDKDILNDMYDSMKRYVKACFFWANLFSFGKNRYIWKELPFMQFGDWVTPDKKKMIDWQKRNKYTSTCSLANSCYLLSKIATILDNKDDSIKYENLFKKVSNAYQSKFLDENGKLKGEQFQTGYVLPLAFNMLDQDMKKKASKNLVNLIISNNYKIGTGFPATPYLLYALSDNGYKDIAFKVLENTSSPSWLYQVKAGATTIWERWDALDEMGKVKEISDGTDNMVSLNHYSFGSVGQFFYNRILGIQQIDSGYKKVLIKPTIAGSLTSAKGQIDTIYGIFFINWEILNNKFNIKVKIPISCSASIVLPSGKKIDVSNGSYTFEEEYKKEL